MAGDGIPSGNVGNGPETGMLNPGNMMAAAKRRAIRQTMRPVQIKHGLIAAPHIQHPRDNTGPSFGQGGGFKASGF